MSEAAIAFEGLALWFFYVKTKEPERRAGSALVSAINHACQERFPPKNSHITILEVWN